MKNYPSAGLTYEEARKLWGCTRKEAIARLNKLIGELGLVYGGKRKGFVFWVKEPPEKELFICREVPGKTEYEKTCLCGKKFKTRMKQKIYCGPLCNSHYSQIKRSEREEHESNAPD